MWVQLFDMKYIFVSLIISLAFISCKDCPKDIIKKAALENLHSKGVDKCTILSVDSLEKWSTYDFKQDCKKQLDTLSQKATLALSLLSVSQQDATFSTKLNALTTTVTDSVQKYIPDLVISYNNIKKQKDVTVYIYKVKYLSTDQQTDSLFVYSNTTYNKFSFSTERNNTNIVDVEFINNVSKFMSRCLYADYMLSNLLEIMYHPEYLKNF